MDREVTVKINGKDVSLNNFVQNIVSDINRAIIENLRIDEKAIKTVEIKITL